MDTGNWDPNYCEVCRCNMGWSKEVVCNRCMVKRLRAALEKIAEDCGYDDPEQVVEDYQGIARRALGGDQ